MSSRVTKFKRPKKNPHNNRGWYGTPIRVRPIEEGKKLTRREKRHAKAQRTVHKRSR